MFKLDGTLTEVDVFGGWMDAADSYKLRHKTPTILLESGFVAQYEGTESL